jgi:hypothetical protein
MPQPDKPTNLFARVWRLCRGAASPHRSEVFLHDPAAAMPHNLDDPFHDAEVQKRVGKIVAGIK